MNANQLQKGVQPMNERSLFVVGFLMGALAGAAAALLLTPYSGEEMRDQLKERGIELRSEAERRAADARTQAEELQAKGRIVLSDNVKKAQEAVQAAQTKLGKTDSGSAEASAA
jgi:gas vesicle protein